jgi:hypothetical protein
MKYTELFAAIQDRVDTVGIDQTKKEISEMKLRVWPIYLPNEPYSEVCDKLDSGEYYSYNE